jgi:hypothetical protein
MPLPSEIGRVLRASLDPVDPGTEVEAVVSGRRPQELRGLGMAAGYHGIPAYVHAATDGLPVVPADERAHLGDVRRQVVLRHLRTVSDLRHLDGVLTAAGIPWLVVKGPTLAEPVHGAAELRYYGDLDLLVPGRHLADAMAALETAGSEVLDRNWTLIGAEMKGEVHLLLPSGTHLDLHWHLFNEPDRRAMFPVTVEELFVRSRHVSVNGAPVRTLSLPDTVVYVSMHMLHSGGDRLIWLKDVERLLAQPDLDPVQVAGCAKAWRGELVLTSALRRVELSFGALPHIRAFRDVCPPARSWSAAASWAWRRSPAEREDGSASLGRIVSRSVRPTQTDSFRELTRRIIQNVRGGREARHDPSRSLPVDDPRSGRYDSGGPSEREAFLARVARDAR